MLSPRPQPPCILLATVAPNCLPSQVPKRLAEVLRGTLTLFLHKSGIRPVAAALANISSGGTRLSHRPHGSHHCELRALECTDGLCHMPPPPPVEQEMEPASSEPQGPPHASWEMEGDGGLCPARRRIGTRVSPGRNPRHKFKEVLTCRTGPQTLCPGALSGFTLVPVLAA